MGTKKVILIVSLVIAGLIGLVILISTLDKSKGNEDYSKHAPKTVVFDNESYVQNRTKNYLIFGLDDDEKFSESKAYYNDNMCDFIMILNIDEANKQYTILEINRDSMVDVIQLDIKQNPIKQRAYKQIAYAFSEGKGTEKSCLNVQHTVEELLYGISINNYLAIKIPAINMVNDYVGGVDITLKEDQDLTKVNPSWTPGSTIHLENGTAEEFVRARQEVSDGTNISRMTRQTQYLEAFIDQVAKKQETSTNVLLNAYLEASDFLMTDIDVNGIDALFNTFKDYEYQGSVTFEGRVEHNEYDNALFYIDEDSFKSIVKKLFFRKYDG